MLLLAATKQESRAWFQSRGLQLPKEGTTHGLVKCIDAGRYLQG